MKTMQERAQEAFDAYDGHETLAGYDQSVAAGFYRDAEEAYAGARAMEAARLACLDIPSSVTGAWQTIYRYALDLGRAEARRQRQAIIRETFPAATA